MAASSIQTTIPASPIFDTGLPPCNQVLNINISSVYLRIFAFLTSELTACAAVCRAWRNLPTQFWQKSISADARDVLTSLVNEKFVSLKEAALYAPLVSLITTSIVDLKRSLGIVRAKNQGAYILAPQPLVQYGNCEIVICNTTDIEVNKKDREPILLDARKKIAITHLAAENRFVFALRQDGKIIQWDYETETIIQEFETVYSKRNDEIRNGKKIEELSCPADFDIDSAQFYVKNGRIIIYSNKKERDDNFIEVIPYEKPKQRRLIKEHPLCYFSNLILQNDLMIGLGKALKDRSGSENAIWIRNLVTGEATSYATELTRSSVDPNALTLDQNKLYIYVRRKPSEKDQLQVFDLKTHTLSTHIFKHSLNLHKYAIINDLMFGAHHTGKSDSHHYRPEQLCIQDLQSRTAWVEIFSSNLKDPENSEEPELLLKEFIMRAKRMIANRKLGTLATEEASCVCVIA